MVRQIRRVSGVLSWASAGAAAVCLTAMVCIIAWQIFTRFFFNVTPFWSEETAQILTIYFALFAAAFGYRERLHIGMEFVQRRLGARVRRVLTTGLDVLAGAFGSAMCVFGLRLVRNTMNQTMPATRIAVGYMYLPLPIAGALICLFAVEKILVGRSTAPTEGSE